MRYLNHALLSSVWLLLLGCPNDSTLRDGGTDSVKTDVRLPDSTASDQETADVGDRDDAAPDIIDRDHSGMDRGEPDGAVSDSGPQDAVADAHIQEDGSGRCHGSTDCDDNDDCTDNICGRDGVCTHPPSSLCQGLVSWWRFDEGSGVLASDSIGVNHGQLFPGRSSGPSWRSGGECLQGGCLRFDGVDDRVDCGSHASLAISGDLTVSLWFMADAWDHNEALLSNGLYELFHRGQWAGDRLYFLQRIDMNSREGDSSWSSKVGVRTSEDLPLGWWRHVAMVKRGTAMEMWIDGVNVRTREQLFENYAASTDLFGTLQIGQGLEPFRGYIDEVKIYERALLPAELCAMCTNNASAFDTVCCQPTCTQEPSACSSAGCHDGKDNDGDGLVDSDDPGCLSHNDADETLRVEEWRRLPLAELQRRFDESFASAWPKGFVDTFPYNIQPPLAGLISMYEATQEPRYIAVGLDSVEASFSAMVDVDGDGSLEWSIGPSQWDHDDDPTTPTRASCLYTQRGIKQFARLARVIKHDAALDAIYGERANAVVAMIKTRIINDPYCRLRFRPGFQTVHHIVSHPTSVLLELYLLEGDRTYLQGEAYTSLATVTAQAALLRDSLFVQPQDPGAVAWGRTGCVDMNYSYPACYDVKVICTDSAGLPWCKPSDVSHGTDFIFTVLELFRARIVFTRADIDALIQTFVHRIWNGNLVHPRWRDFVDGHNEMPGGTYGPWSMGGNVAPGWVELASFDDELQRLFELAERSGFTDKRRLSEEAWYGYLARNARVGDCRYSNRAREIADGVDNDCDGLIDE